jgi:hypothetical protein
LGAISSGGVLVANRAQKRRTDCTPKHRLAPLDLDVLDPIAFEKVKDVLGYVVGGIGGGRARINSHPDNDGTRTILFVGFVGDEGSDINGRIANLL